MPDKDEFTDSFHRMRDGMTPPPELVAQLRAALDADASVGDVGTTGAGVGGSLASRPGTGGGTGSGPLTARPGTTGPDASGPRATRPGVTGAGMAGRRGLWARARRGMGAMSGGLVAVVVAAVMLVGGLPLTRMFTPPVVPPANPTHPPTERVEVDAGAYTALYKLVSGALTSVGYGNMGGVDDRGPVVPAPGEASGTAKSDPAGGPYTSSAGTNVQVAGIDEGDIVKTDGSYIYIARGREVIVVRADGAATHRVATLDLSAKTTPDELLAGPVMDMMIDKTTLVVLSHAMTGDIGNWSKAGGSSMTLQATTLKATFFDIADPTNPKQLSQLTQSGAYLQSRLSDGVLYLVSSYWVNGGGVVMTEPGTFVPCVDAGSGPVPVAPSDVYPMPYVQSPAYSVVTAIDVATRQVLGEQAVLGYAGTIYMSEANLYLTSGQWFYPGDGSSPTAKVTIPGYKGQFQGAQTNLVRIGLHGGRLSVDAEGAVAGDLVNQFALDESDGYLRVATTWQGTEDNNWASYASLWVLDPKLKVVGSIPQLVKGESIQSVRFVGSVGYVVTYLQRDPLFAIDLSKPTKPEVRGALKIPGFSTYLHPFTDGLLLGVGVNTDDQGNQLKDGVKLSMFDVRDPYNVRELATSPVAASYTEVSGNHKAAFVDSERGLVGLPVVKWSEGTKDGQPAMTGTWDYKLYGWTGKEFTAVTSIDLLAGTGKALENIPDTSARGLEVDGVLYVVTLDGVVACDLGTFTNLAKVPLK